VSYRPALPPVLIMSKVAMVLATELIRTQRWPFLRTHIDLRRQNLDWLPSGALVAAALTASIWSHQENLDS
jgi:hypothetical protein